MPYLPENHNLKLSTPKHENRRAKTAERGYGGRWQRLRKLHLARFPLCVACQAKGIIQVATDVDHHVAHRGDVFLFWDESNWRSLCASCHSSKTAREDGGFGNRHAVRR